jgi:hypothetical protein
MPTLFFALASSAAQLLSAVVSLFAKKFLSQFSEKNTLAPEGSFLNVKWVFESKNAYVMFA